MIRPYRQPEDLKKHGYPPRIVISMNVYEDIFECGFNCHYSIDSNLMECCEDFFKTMRLEHPEGKIEINRSKLNIRYVDLPKF